MDKYRNELKFLCSQIELEILRGRIAPIMNQDVHQGEKGYYNIRSLYFDDYHNSCLRENESGVDNRKKFRIRIYDKNAERIQLEVKYKLRGLTRKESCPLTKEQCDALIMGTGIEYKQKYEKPLRMLYTEMQTKNMRPVEIVEYERTAFTYRPGNVRITFDCNIAGSQHIKDFFQKKIPLMPVLPPGQHILEVKYDEFLPDFIAQVMDIGSLSRTSFSKYYICRGCKVE